MARPDHEAHSHAGIFNHRPFGAVLVDTCCGNERDRGPDSAFDRLSSGYLDELEDSNLVCYSAVKAGVIALTRR
jgi:hypothetical protein